MRRDNLDLLRLLAAAAVLVSHGLLISGGEEPVVIGALSVGAVGVLVFFSISGYLVTLSWLRDPHVLRFGLKRATRIYPAYVVLLIATAFVIGPAVTTAGDYLAGGDPARYVVDNLTLRMGYLLPGVFSDNPTEVVNGSLWSLRYETRVYALLLILGALGALRRRWLATVLLASAQVVLAVGDQHLVVRAFCLAILIALWRDEIPWRWSIAAGLLGAWVASSAAGAAGYVAPLVIPYLTLMLAYRAPAVTELTTTRRGAPWDVSYGLYLWAFPVCQVIEHLWHPAAWVLIAAGFVVTYLLAAASWTLIERPALVAVKARLQGSAHGHGSIPRAAATVPASVTSSG
ncbi:MAG: acyltransferase [Thermoleophilia bacterium]|nr:acyltransferase [Thermoleophilia bacterium]